jgi:adenylate cyclase
MMVRQRFRGLFQAVAIPLAINGVIEAWLGYRD